MSKSRNKNKSEVEFLRGKVRRLEAQLKYFKQREHFFEAPIEEIEEVQDIRANQCPFCKKGIIIEYDFHRAVLRKCSECDFQERKKKKV